MNAQAGFRVEIWVDVEGEVGDGQVDLTSVKVYDNEILQHLSRWDQVSIERKMIEALKDEDAARRDGA